MDRRPCPSVATLPRKDCAPPPRATVPPHFEKRSAGPVRSKFYGMDELVSNPNITPSDYKDLFPIFVFDVSRQSEKLKNSVTDIQVKAYFNENVPANTEAFAVVISDRVVSFTSNGNKMTVIS